MITWHYCIHVWTEQVLPLSALVLIAVYWSSKPSQHCVTLGQFRQWLINAYPSRISGDIELPKAEVYVCLSAILRVQP
jgi:hypothetical protein